MSKYTTTFYSRQQFGTWTITSDASSLEEGRVANTNKLVQSFMKDLDMSHDEASDYVVKLEFYIVVTFLGDVFEDHNLVEVH